MAGIRPWLALYDGVPGTSGARIVAATPSIAAIDGFVKAYAMEATARGASAPDGIGRAVGVLDGESLAAWWAERIGDA